MSQAGFEQNTSVFKQSNPWPQTARPLGPAVLHTGSHTSRQFSLNGISHYLILLLFGWAFSVKFSHYCCDSHGYFKCLSITLDLLIDLTFFIQLNIFSERWELPNTDDSHQICFLSSGTSNNYSLLRMTMLRKFYCCPHKTQRRTDPCCCCCLRRWTETMTLNWGHQWMGLLFIPQVIHEHREPRWNDTDSGKP
jgi:hypothetical protein